MLVRVIIRLMALASLVGFFVVLGNAERQHDGPDGKELLVAFAALALAFLLFMFALFYRTQAEERAEAREKEASEEASRQARLRFQNTWGILQTGLTEQDVRLLLGQPRAIKLAGGNSEWHYGLPLVGGVVTFSKGKIVGFSLPKL